MSVDSREGTAGADSAAASTLPRKKWAKRPRPPIAAATCADGCCFLTDDTGESDRCCLPEAAAGVLDKVVGENATPPLLLALPTTLPSPAAGDVNMSIAATAAGPPLPLPSKPVAPAAT